MYPKTRQPNSTHEGTSGGDRAERGQSPTTTIVQVCWWWRNREWPQGSVRLCPILNGLDPLSVPTAQLIWDTCRYQGVVKCSQAIARINRQEIVRSIEELPEPPPAPMLLHAVLPYCVAGDAGTPRKGYLDALQYALTRTPMTKEVLITHATVVLRVKLSTHMHT